MTRMFILKSLKSCVMRESRLLPVMMDFVYFDAWIAVINGSHPIFAKVGFVFVAVNDFIRLELLNALGRLGSFKSGVTPFLPCLLNFGTVSFLGVILKDSDRLLFVLQDVLSGMGG